MELQPALEIDTTDVAESIKPELSAGNELKAFAESYEIDDQDSADNFAEWRNQIDAREKRIIERMGPVKKAAHEAHKRVCDLEAEALRPLREAKQVSNRKLVIWHDDQERLAAERKRQADAEERRIEEERRLAEAADLEAAGEHKAAAAVINEPIIASAPPAPKPKVLGTNFSVTYKAEITNKAEFLKFVAATPALLHLADPNLVALNQLARAQKEMLNLPGVRVVKEKQVARGR